MAVTLNSNIASLGAQRQLAKNSRVLEQSFQRLSSGLRINRASDDASGLAISSLLSADARVFNQGVRNLNDGISLLNIAEGGLQQASSIIIRLRELATQAANGTLSFSQRKALGQEAVAIVNEYNRIIKSVSFNNVKLLDGSLETLTVQGSYGVNGGISFGLGDDLARTSGTGTLSEVTQALFTPAGLVLGLSSGDFNNDGNADQVWSDNAAGLIYSFSGGGDGTFSTSAVISAGYGLDYFGEAADFNGDGNLDIFGIDATSLNRIVIMLGNGDGTFQNATFTDTDSSSLNPRFGDFNGDGNTDILAQSGTTELQVFFGNGDGTLQERQHIDVGQAPLDTAVKDFNNDGFSDFAYFTTDGTMASYLGSADGSFSLAGSLATGVDYAQIGVADFNLDGNVDYVLSSPSAVMTKVAFGNGDGTFRISDPINTGSTTVSVTVAGLDINGDNIADIVQTDGEVNYNVAFGRGDGTFENPIRSRYELEIFVPLTDFNNDGILDTVSLNLDRTQISARLGITGSTTTLAQVRLFTREEALESMAKLDQALERVNQELGSLGSAQSRIEVAINNLRQGSENYRTAESRIVDVDIADESSSLQKNRILQQAATAILAQANQLPELALGLLGRR